MSTIPAWKANGSPASGTGTISVPWPIGHAAGDLAILVVNTSNESLATPSGWTKKTGLLGTGTAATANSAGMYIFWRIATSGAEADAAVADSGNHTLGVISTFTGCSVPGVDTFNSSTGASNGTNVAFNGVTTLVNNCLIITAVSSGQESTFSGWTFAGLGSYTARATGTTTSGVDGGVAIASGSKAVAGATGNGQCTASISSKYVSVTFELRPDDYDQTITASAIAGAEAFGAMLPPTGVTRAGTDVFPVGIAGAGTVPSPTVAKIYGVTQTVACVEYTGLGATGQTITTGIVRDGRAMCAWLPRRGASVVAQPSFFLAAGSDNTAPTYTISPAGSVTSVSEVSFNSAGDLVLTAFGPWNVASTQHMAYVIAASPGVFDYVTYVGTGSGVTQVVNHALGIAPGVMISASASEAELWYHHSLGNGSALQQVDGSSVLSGSYWASTDPTSTQFSVSGNRNTSGQTYHVALFGHASSISDFVRCGVFTGNGSASGPTESLGWKPQILFTKSGSTSGTPGDETRAGKWVDGLRTPSFSGTDYVSYHLSTGTDEKTIEAFSHTSDGFGVVTADSKYNLSGASYYYIAFRGLAQTVSVSAIASDEAFGTAIVSSISNATVFPSAIAGGEAFGDAVVVGGGSAVLTPSAIDSVEAFGTPVVILAQFISANGIASAQALGTFAVGGGAIIVSGGYGTGLIGVAYAASSVSASAGFPGYTWTLQSGSLPAGLSLTAGTGVLTGTPTTFGTASFTLRVTDSLSFYVDVAFTLKVVPYAPDFVEVVSYSGNGSSGRTIGALDLSNGGIVLIKRRNAVGTGEMYWSADGTTVYRQQIAFDDAGGTVDSPDARPMVTPTGSFTAAGFTQSGTVMNASGGTYIAWMFAKTPGFLDVMTYTGNGTTPRSLSHSLGAVPVLAFVARSDNDATGYLANYNLYAGSSTYEYGAWSTGLHEYNYASLAAAPTASTIELADTNTNVNTVPYIVALFNSDPDIGAQLLLQNTFYSTASMLTHNAALLYTRRLPKVFLRLGINALDIVDNARNSNWGATTKWLPMEANLDEDTGTTDSPYSAQAGQVRQTYLYNPFAAPPEATNYWGYGSSFYYVESATLAAGVYPAAVPSNERFGNATIAGSLTIAEPRSMFCYKDALFSFTPTLVNSVGGTVWSISAGSLPPGVSLVGDTLTGIATKSGVYDFTMQAVEGSTVTRDMRVIVGVSKIQRHAQSFQYTGDGTTNRFIPTTVALDRGGIVAINYYYQEGTSPPTSNTSGGFFWSREGEAVVETRKQASSPFYYSGAASISFGARGFTINSDAERTNKAGRLYTVMAFSRDDKFCDVYAYTGTGVRRELLHDLQGAPAAVFSLRLEEGTPNPGAYAFYDGHHTFDYTAPSASGVLSSAYTDGSQLNGGTRHGPNVTSKAYILFAFSGAYSDEVYSSSAETTTSYPQVHTTGWPPSWFLSSPAEGDGEAQYQSVGFASFGTGWEVSTPTRSYTPLSATDCFFQSPGSWSARYSRTNTSFSFTASPKPYAQLLLFRDPGLDQEILPTGIASAEAFGTATIGRGPVSVAPSGIPSAEAFGTASVVFVVKPSAIASAEVFGTPAIAISGVSIFVTGIPSDEFLCVNTIVSLAGGVQYAQPFAITSAEAFGTAQLNQTLYAPAITSAEAFGTALLTSYIAAAGIASAEAFGTPLLTSGISAVGIASAEAFGTPRIGLYILTAGIATREAFGTPSLRHKRVYFDGIASAEAFGTPEVIGGIRPYPIGSLEAVNDPRISITVPVQSFFDSAVGVPSITFATYPSSIPSAEAFGLAALSLHLYVDSIDASYALNAPRVSRLLGISSLDSAEAFGTPVLVSRQMILPSSFSSGAAVGTPVLNTPAASVLPLAIDDNGSPMGVPQLDLRLYVSAIDSSEQLGNSVLSVSAREIQPTSFGGDVIGSPIIVVGGVVVSLVGVASEESVNSHTVSHSFAQQIEATGLPSAEALGYPVVSGGCETAIMVVVRSPPAPTIITVGEC